MNKRTSRFKRLVSMFLAFTMILSLMFSGTVVAKGTNYETQSGGEGIQTEADSDIILEHAIEYAYQTKAGVSVSLNGNDVAANVHWVTQEIMEDLDSAIREAETELDKEVAELQLNDAIEKLNSEISSFIAAARTGSLAAPLNEESSRIIFNVPYSADIIDKTISADGFLCNPSALFGPVDVSMYSKSTLGLELDLYVEGNLNAFKKAEGQLELTSSGKNDSQELSWNPINFNWENGKWIRVTLPLNSANQDPTFNLANINYIRMYVVGMKDGIDQKFTLKIRNTRLVDLDQPPTNDPIGDNTEEGSETKQRIINNIPYTIDVNNADITNGTLHNSDKKFGPFDISGYNNSNVAIELDVYFDGDLSKFKSAGESRLELTSSGTHDQQSISWDPRSWDLTNGEWVRLTLPMKVGAINPANINYLRFYMINMGSMKVTFKVCNVRLVDTTADPLPHPYGDGSIPDRSTLTIAIAEAKRISVSILAADSGNDLAFAKFWVPQSAKEELDAAISIAEEAKGKVATYEEAVSAANTLESACEAFKAARQHGTIRSHTIEQLPLNLNLVGWDNLYSWQKNDNAKENFKVLIDRMESFGPLDITMYDKNEVALELDAFISADLDLLKDVTNGRLTLSNDEKGKNSISWDTNQLPWQNGKWIRLSLPLSEADFETGQLGLEKLNYIRLYIEDPKELLEPIILKIKNVRLVDLTTEDSADPIGDGTFIPEAPKLALAPTIYETNETVVMSYNLKDFLENYNGEDDVAPIIQSLLDSLRILGGGTLFIPEGEYALRTSILIPEGVTICGDWRAPADENPKVVGTLLKAYYGRGFSDAKISGLINMKPNSMIHDLTIWYPEQDSENIVPYQDTIQMYLADNWGADYTHIRNITFVNSYIAIRQWATESCGCANIHNVYGTPLKTGVDMDSLSDIGRFDYIYFSPEYWENSGLPGAPVTTAQRNTLRDYIYDNGVGIILRRIDWSYLCYTEITGYNTGLQFSPSITNNGANPNGHCYGLTFKDCQTAILVESLANEGEMISNVDIENCQYGIRTARRNNTTGNAEFFAVRINATDKAILHEGRFPLSLLKSTVKNGEVVSNNGGSFVITDCNFNTAAPHVKSGVGAGMILLGNRANGDYNKFEYLCPVNNVQCPVIFDPSPVDIEMPVLLTAEQAKDKVAKPGRSELYIAELDSTGETDITDDLQDLLDKAGSEGGGVVFLSPGNYRLNGSITIPTGVELKGASDIGRIPFKIGTILRIYGGQGEAEGTAAVKLSEKSGIRGIIFDYPEQDYLDLKEYPYSIQGMGSDIYIVNVSLRNAYNGIDLTTYQCDRHYIMFLAGVALNNWIRVGNGAKDGFIANYQMNSQALVHGKECKYGVWENSPTGAGVEAVYVQLLRTRVQQNLVVLQVGDVEGQILYDNFSWLGNRGMLFVEENGKGANGYCVGHGIDFSTVGIELQAIGNMNFINTQIVSFIQGLTAAQLNNTFHKIYASDNFEGEAKFYGVSCWGNSYSDLRVESGQVKIYNGTFNSSITDNNASAFIKMGAEGRLDMINGSLHGSGATYMVRNNADNVSAKGLFYIRNGLANIDNTKNIRFVNNSLDTTALINALLNTKAAKAGIVVSVNDGLDIYPQIYWVTQDAMDEFNSIVKAAETAQYTAATNAEVTAAVNMVNSAISVFEAEKQQGKKIDIPISGIKLNTSMLNMKTGEKAALTATILPLDASNRQVNWRSSNSGVAAVTNGVVTAAKAGSTVITATANDGHEVSCVIIVK